MHSVVSFELDDDCVLQNIFTDELFFHQSIHLTDIRITLFEFEQCICLLNQLSSQLSSLTVSVMSVRLRDVRFLSEMKSVSNVHLFEFSLN
jgi:hypothetical protein